jgi:hypothetical protein
MILMQRVKFPDSILKQFKLSHSLDDWLVSFLLQLSWARLNMYTFPYFNTAKLKYILILFHVILQHECY